jgi:hypothetical protein
VAVDVVQFRRELALFSKDARLCTLDRVLDGRGGTAVAVDALDVRAAATMDARSHPGNESQSVQFVSGRLIGVDVGAGASIGTLLAQKVYIAHFHFLDSVHLFLIVIAAGRVHTLPGPITCNDLVAICRFVLR